MKERARRLKLIRRLIEENPVPNQDSLLRLLENEGVTVTQATLSRDLKLLRVGKINDGERDYVLETDLAANQALCIDSEQRQVTIDGEQTVLSLDAYPMLSPGENTMTISVVPEISATQCRLGFRDFWV